MNGSPTYWRQSGNVYTIPLKMLMPLILPGIKYGGLVICKRINGREPGRLVQRTSYTCQRQVSLNRFTTSGRGYNMVNVKSGDLTFLRQPAILAPIFGPCHHKTT